MISEVLGCNKPDPWMYAAVSYIMGLPPAGCLFIDDDQELVVAAVALGYQGVALTRPVQAVDQRNDRPVPGIRMVSSLEELLPLVAAPA